MVVAREPGDRSAPDSRSLRSRVLAGDRTVGTFLTLGSPVTAEICADAGFDWLIIDLEHGSGTAADLLGQLQAVNGTGVCPLVRVEVTARNHVSRALDPGARGIMFPRIESSVEASEAIRFLRFPPGGVRGVGLQNRTGRFGRIQVGELVAVDQDLLGIVQVETTGSLADLDAIAAVDGVDVLFVGPSDLSYALGVPGRLDDESYLAALDAVVAACRNGSCTPGILAASLTDAERHLARGFRFVAIGSDSSLLVQGATAAVSSFRATLTRAAS